MHRQSGFAYRPALDGLRALAVLAVIGYHLNLSWAKGGYLGVDTFFVLSGYLITSLLLGEHRAGGGIDLAAFWGRRARRLLPAVLLVVLGVALYAATWASADQFETLRKDGWATLAYVANWRLISAHQSYFDLFSAPSPLRHMWSLAIEEQFYLFWPLVVFLVMGSGRGRRSLLTVVTVGGIVASSTWMAVHYSVADPSRTYYGTDTRAHSLLVGCLLALFLERRAAFSPRMQARVQAMGVVAGIGLLVALYSISDTNRAMYHGGFLLYAVGVAVVVTAAVQTTWSPLRSVLSFEPLRWIGTISYGLYLWHWPAIVILTPSRMHVHGDALRLVQVAATFAVASASFYLVERPIRYGTLPNRAVLVSAPAALVVVGIVLAGATVGAKTTFDATATITAPTTTTTVPGATTTTAKPGAPRAMTIAVVGDSVAGTIVWGLDDVVKGTPVHIVSSAYPGCGVAAGLVVDQSGKPFPWSKPCFENVPHVHEEMIAQQHPSVVLWSSSWELSDRMDQATNTVLKFGSKADDVDLLTSIDAAAKRLTSGGAHLVILTVPPRAPSDAKPADGQDGSYDHYNRLLREYASAHPATVSVLDIVPFVCPGGPPCPAKVRGVTLRPDGGHFTHETAPIIARWLLPKLIADAPAS
ncbi:MAG: hypothetical protein JWL83_4879 [Actinomycetia bacterium]|nr:hypothetical protein [Actinomycetes bacterium]